MEIANLKFIGLLLSTLKELRFNDEKQLVFGTLHNEPLNDYEGKVELGSELAVNHSQIGEHKKAFEFRPKS
jgi:hypothetical protein